MSTCLKTPDTTGMVLAHNGLGTRSFGLRAWLQAPDPSELEPCACDRINKRHYRLNSGYH